MLKELRHIDEDSVVCIYGACKYGKIVLNALLKYRIQVRFYIDDNIRMQHTLVNGIKVISLKEAKQCFSDQLIIIAGNYYLSDMLEKLNYEKIDLKQFHFINELLIEDLDLNSINKNRHLIEQIYDYLADYKSKQIYSALFQCRKYKKTEILSLLHEDIQYFPNDIFHFTDEEVFVDGGAYTGDTIEILFDKILSHKKPKHVYAFEPDHINFERIVQNYGNNECVTIKNTGLYSSNGILDFNGGMGGSSAVDCGGGDSVRVEALDLADLEFNITMIKMDIEGCELEALKGAKKIIKTCRPKLAICIYHKQEDLWKIPCYIKKLVPEYKLYIRNYTNWLDEVVLYATI